MARERSWVRWMKPAMRRMLLVAAVLGASLAPGGARAQDPKLDTPFPAPKYLVHHSGRGTSGGFQPLDYYSLEATPPQGPTMQTAGGDGTTFTDNVELAGGPYSTLRQVCDALRAPQLSAHAGSLGCPPAAPPPQPAAPAPTETAPSQAAVPAPPPPQPQTAAPAVPPPTEAPPPPVLGQAPTETAPATQSPPVQPAGDTGGFWDSLPPFGKFAVVAGVLILLKALFGSATPAFTVRGKVSWFGGPNDPNMKPNEGLALVNDSNFKEYADLFLPNQPPGTTGLAKRLDPSKAYVACRWDYNKTPRGMLKNARVKVTNVRTGTSVFVRPVDWGPAEWTKKAVDLSPGAMDALNVKTGDEVEVRVLK